MIIKRQILVFLLTFIVFLTYSSSKVEISNSTSTLLVDSNGGAIISFSLVNDTINPFTWKLSKEQMPVNNRNGASFEGHFICLGRWGNPTEGEIKAGIPNNGHIGNIQWNIISQNKSDIEFLVNSELDLMSLKREIKLDEKQPMFLVKDSVVNRSQIGRLFNIVQHATIGQPFLNCGTLIDTNASLGFMQDKWKPNPELHSFSWPMGVSALNDSVINLRQSNGVESYVSSHIINDSIGWVTAFCPEYKLLLGYLWKVEDYPWINIWHQTENKIPIAKGIEFGTTGIGAPYQELLNNSSFYGVNSFFFFDALDSFQKKFICFLIPTYETIEGVESIKLQNNNLLVTLLKKGDNYPIMESVIINSELLKEL